MSGQAIRRPLNHCGNLGCNREQADEREQVIVRGPSNEPLVLAVPFERLYQSIADRASVKQANARFACLTELNLRGKRVKEILERWLTRKPDNCVATRSEVNMRQSTRVTDTQ